MPIEGAIHLRSHSIPLMLIARFSLLFSLISSFKAWGPGQPDDFSVLGEDCVELQTTNGMWNDLNCIVPRYYICARDLSKSKKICLGYFIFCICDAIKQNESELEKKRNKYSFQSDCMPDHLELYFDENPSKLNL